MQHVKLLALSSALVMALVSAAHAGGPWVHNVAGGGQDSYPNANGNPTFTIEFNARQNADGDTFGAVDWWFLDGRLASSGQVECLEVRGNRAFMMYRAEAGEFGAYGAPGNQIFLGLEDNGEGKNADPDRQTYIYYANWGADCSNLAGFADWIEGSSGFPVVWLHGNVQVR